VQPLPKAAYLSNFRENTHKLLPTARFYPDASRAAGKRATIDHCKLLLSAAVAGEQYVTTRRKFTAQQ